MVKMLKTLLFYILIKNKYTFFFYNYNKFFNYFYFCPKTLSISNSSINKYKKINNDTNINIENYQHNLKFKFLFYTCSNSILNINNYYFFRSVKSFNVFKNLKNFWLRFNFDFNFLCFYILKMHGINMRFYKWQVTNSFFFRIGSSHGFFFRNYFKNFNILIFKKRYILISSNNLLFLNNLIFFFKSLKRFFKYKLIGIKLERDSFRLKVGKKKIF